ncbi:hypothetical protein [Altericista sp. CCNU0014]|uniref:hypothetical protein n=1 Tax=Altericista sp. CCNU0014 TaxID=3082949 RepID=UPI00384DB82C
MSHKSPENDGPQERSNAAGLERSLGLIAIPVLLGLVALRQVERQLTQLGQFSESLLQGERLPILDRRCSGVQNSDRPRAVR